MTARTQTNLATRAEAMRRLERFLPHAGRTYAATRNEDRGLADRGNVSMLSPYLRRRIITEAEVVRAVSRQHAPSASRKFVQEILWRTYWKGVLEQRPGLWYGYRAGLEEHATLSPDLATRYDAATAGATGIGAFDDWTRELVETGYLHNHARMWYASIWIFTLRLPWELGAAFFLEHLLDGDPASNTLSWRWVAGLHTRGRTYLATRGNIRRYTNGRIDPGDVLAARAEPPADRPLPERRALPVSPAPAAGPALLVLHEDDLGVETLPTDSAEIRTVVGLTAALGRADAVERFASDALDDALQRAADRYRRPVQRLDSRADAAPEALAALVRACDAQTVLVPYAPVGPLQDVLARITAALPQHELRAASLLRAWDATLWPLATAGFFGFWSAAERRPDLLFAANGGVAPLSSSA